MAAALGLARRGLGQVWPNPAVGCLIVRDEDGDLRIVGRGWTQPGGRPHAETEALSQAGGEARGATAYVTLEPCAHHGETPPCAEALVEAGVSRVVSAMGDPDPRVDGGGHTILREAGVSVSTDVLTEQAADVNAGFLTRIRAGRPHVTLKLAVSGDHRIAARPGVSTAITGDQARAWSHMMRAQTDAIMVGAGTWRVDDPELTCRLPGLQARSPVRVILDARAELPPSARLLESVEATPLWVVTGPDADRSRCDALRDAGAEVIASELRADGRLDPASVLRLLGGRGITRLLVEGGALLAADLIDNGLVDAMAVFTAPGKLGGQGVPAVAGRALADVLDPAEFALVSERTLGADTLRSYQRLV